MEIRNELVRKQEIGIVKLLENHIHSEIQEELPYMCKDLDIDEIEEVGVGEIFKVIVTGKGEYDGDLEEKEEWLWLQKEHKGTLNRVEKDLTDLNNTMRDYGRSLSQEELTDLILDIRNKMKEYDIDYLVEKHIAEDLNRERIEGICTIEVQVEYLDSNQDYFLTDIKVNLSFELEKSSTGKLKPVSVELLSCES